MSEMTSEKIKLNLDSHLGYGDGGWISHDDFRRGLDALERGDLDGALAVVRLGDENARRWEETYGYTAQKRRHQERGIQID